MSLADAEFIHVNPPKISIIIPVYNMENYLEQCLDSVVNQTLKNIEIICINDGSTDNSLQILKDYAAKDERFILLNQENTGQGIARNKCIEIAKGEYLAFVDPDDWVDVHMYEELYDAAIQYNCDIVECDYVEHRADGTERQMCRDHIVLKKTKINIHQRNPFIWHEIGPAFIWLPRMPWIRIVKKDLVLREKLAFTQARRLEDQAFSMGSLLAANQIYYCNKNLYHYRVMLENKRFKRSLKFYQDAFILWHSIDAIFTKYSAYDRLEDEIDNHLVKAFCGRLELIPYSSMPRFFIESKKTMKPKQYALFKKECRKQYSHIVTNFAELFFACKKKKVGTRVVKEFSIFTIPLLRINCSKK